MKQKTVKTLLIFATALFAFALLCTILAIFAQNLIKTIYYGAGYLSDVRTAPYHSIIICLVHTLMAAAALVFFLKGVQRSGTIAITIVTAVLFILFNSLISPVIGTVVTTQLLHDGSEAIAAYNVVSAGTNLLVAPFTYTADVLLFLALGGACANSAHKQPE